jgi:hypothetical protein
MTQRKRTISASSVTRSLFIAACLILICLVAPPAWSSSPSGSGFPAAASRSPQSSTASSSSSSKKKKSKRKSAKREPKQTAPDSDRITQIQTALSRGGYYQGDASGKWDADTVAALQKFQSSNGLDATGKLDALSLQKLGLGSEIAGVSAPKPVVRVSVTPDSPSSAPAASNPPPGSNSAVSSSSTN